MTDTSIETTPPKGAMRRGDPSAQAFQSAEEPLEYLTFTMRDQFFAADIMLVREIRGWSKPTPLPHAPEYMRGVINMRGTVLPILDLSARLNGEPTEASERNVIIVVETDRQIVGLLVDAVSDILTLEQSQLQPPPEMPGERVSSCIGALAVVEEDMIRILDLAPLLSDADDTSL